MGDSPIHNGHRNRIKSRFLNEGLDNFEQHNILELLLFYAIPRSDTNVIAHDLIRRFKKLSEVFDAPFQELIQINGISENVAILIKLIPQICRHYINDRFVIPEFMNSADKLGEYFINKFIGINNEIVFLMCLDSSLSILSCQELTKGTVSMANIDMRVIFENVIKNNAVCVVLAHNHPRGIAAPSSSDIASTTKIIDALKIINVSFVDHIIVAENDFCSLVQKKYITQK
ncbi:MAG: JAB domain-containing protein [Oscillospiraceae bacterium]